MTERPDRNLAMELVRVTEAAALAAGRWIGRGDKNAADQAAVDAMRLMLDTVSMSGSVVIGEGEKDEAPMLYNGEAIGSGHGPAVDVAVDPLEGTRLTALGMPNAIAVIAVADLLAVEEHRRLVLLALADHDDAVHRDRVEDEAHRVDRRLVGGDLVAAPDPAGRGKRRGLGHAHELEREVAVRLGGRALHRPGSLFESLRCALCRYTAHKAHRKGLAG